jgi:hypothetical protein
MLLRWEAVTSSPGAPVECQQKLWPWRRDVERCHHTRVCRSVRAAR